MSDDVKERVASAIADALGPDSFDCTRVWSAWSYGTMGPDDFIETHQRADEIATASFLGLRPGDEIDLGEFGTVVLAPKEPTTGMANAGMIASSCRVPVEKVYRAMLAAVKEPGR